MDGGSGNGIGIESRKHGSFFRGHVASLIFWLKNIHDERELGPDLEPLLLCDPHMLPPLLYRNL